MLAYAFDPSLPLITTSAFDGVAAGQPFDWRAKGLAEIDVLALFRSGVVRHPTIFDATPAGPAAPMKPRAQRR